MGRIDLKISKSAPVFRKIAGGTWNSGGDPSVYGILDIDMTNALLEIKKIEIERKIKITPAHLVGKAIATAMIERPEINGLMRFNRIYHRNQVDIFYQVNVEGKHDSKVSKANLSGVVIRNAQNLSLIEIAQSLTLKAGLVRSGENDQFASTFNLFKILPWFFSGIALKIFSFLNYDLNLNLSSMGLPKDPFGSVMITNVGSLGIDFAFAPLVPYSRVPLLLSVGAIKEEAVVINGKIEIRPMLKIGVTFDHRFMDGVHAAEMAKQFKKYFTFNQGENS